MKSQYLICVPRCGEGILESATLTDVSDFIEHMLHARVTPYVMGYEGCSSAPYSFLVAGVGSRDVSYHQIILCIYIQIYAKECNHPLMDIQCYKGLDMANVHVDSSQKTFCDLSRIFAARKEEGRQY